MEYVYTGGMTEAELDARLREETAGVLALADGGRAYAVPVSFAWDGGRILFRLGDDGNGEKLAYVDATTEATFLLYGVASPTDSWSVLARGSIRELSPADVGIEGGAGAEDGEGDEDGTGESDEDGAGESDEDGTGNGDEDGTGDEDGVRPDDRDGTDEIDEAWLNERFGPLRVFDEDVGELRPRLFALEPVELIGRRTLW